MGTVAQVRGHVNEIYGHMIKVEAWNIRKFYKALVIETNKMSINLL